jgi:hypothetical protein
MLAVLLALLLALLCVVAELVPLHVASVCIEHIRRVADVT